MENTLTIDLTKLEDYSIKELQEEISKHRKILKTMCEVLLKKKGEMIKKSMINERGV